MTEPTAVTTTTAMISAFSVATIYPNIENGIILGALCGSILLILNEGNITILRRISLFFISFVLGMLLSEFTAELISGILPDALRDKMPFSLGALIASAVSVKLMLWLIKHIDNPLAVINFLKGNKP